MFEPIGLNRSPLGGSGALVLLDRVFVEGVSRGQGSRSAFHLAAVELAQFPIEDVGGPAIKNDVVRGEDQQMLVRSQPNQAAAEERAVVKIERSGSFAGEQSFEPFLTCERGKRSLGNAAEVLALEAKRNLRGDVHECRHSRQRLSARPHAGQ